jgi:GxxExxY protein
VENSRIHTRRQSYVVAGARRDGIPGAFAAEEPFVPTHPAYPFESSPDIYESLTTAGIFLPRRRREFYLRGAAKSMEQDSVLTRRVIGCAIEVHRTLGPGLLESVYEACLCHELTWAGIAHARQQKLPVIYKGDHVDCDLKIDVIVEQSLVLEIKSVQQILPVHEAQLLTYLRVSGFPLGLLLNFDEETMKQGIRRRIL